MRQRVKLDILLEQEIMSQSIKHTIYPNQHIE